MTIIDLLFIASYPPTHKTPFSSRLTERVSLAGSSLEVPVVSFIRGRSCGLNSPRAATATGPATYSSRPCRRTLVPS